ncbi:response regulator [uncultured Robinsoniella sp.]|uniref:response regulator n=1 Tax=uncultured Robinsoniella sp. TaxID=904190 RepID=UPI00374FC59D
MIKVFIVEDETVIREGIKRRIDWEGNGLCLVGEAGDGELAYPMILETKPDLLITDIMMPFMDGLELSELVKKEMPQIKIIIISGFEHFVYANRALKIGIVDYLSKPVDARKLLNIMIQVKEQIAGEKQKRKYIELYEMEREKKRILKKNQLFNDMISDRCSVSEIISRGMQLQIDLAAKAYNIILFQCWQDKTEVQSNLSEQALMDIIAEKLEREQYNAVYFNRESEGGAVLVKGKDRDELNSTVNNMLKTLEQIAQSCPGYRYFAGVGQCFARLRDITKCYYQANKAFAYRLFDQSKKVVFSAELPDIDREQGLQINMDEIDLGKMDKDTLEDFLKNGSRQEASAFIDSYIESIGKANMESMIFRQYIVLDTNFAALRFLKRIGNKEETLKEHHTKVGDLLANISSTELTRNYLIKILELCIETRDQMSKSRLEGWIEDAKDYINEHYGDEKISLNAVAAYVNVSPNHFSRVFRQVEGKTFVEYLTNTRLNKAKEMLRCSSMKTSDIGSRLGYRDAHYFYYIFKKEVGCTPKDYRMKSVV